MKFEKGETTKTVIINIMCSLGCLCAPIWLKDYLDEFNGMLIGTLLGGGCGTLLGVYIVRYLGLDDKRAVNNILMYLIILVLSCTATSIFLVTNYEESESSIFKIFFFIVMSGFLSLLWTNTIIMSFKNLGKLKAILILVGLVGFGAFMTYSTLSTIMYSEGKINSTSASMDEIIEEIKNNTRYALFYFMAYSSLLPSRNLRYMGTMSLMDFTNDKKENSA